MKMLDKTEQSDRASNPNEKPENCYCSALPKVHVPTLLYAMAGPAVRPVIREKSQFRAQHEFAVIEYPLMTAPAFI
jgi:hypothetical protein